MLRQKGGHPKIRATAEDYLPDAVAALQQRAAALVALRPGCQRVIALDHDRIDGQRRFGSVELGLQRGDDRVAVGQASGVNHRRHVVTLVHGAIHCGHVVTFGHGAVSGPVHRAHVMRHCARFAGVIDRNLDHLIAAAFEGQGQADDIAILQIAGQPHQHDVIAAAFKRMGLHRGDGKAFGDVHHLHHPIGTRLVGVQFDLLGHVRGGADQAVILHRVILHQEEDRARGTYAAHAAGIGIGDPHAIMGESGKAEQGCGCGSHKSLKP